MADLQNRTTDIVLILHKLNHGIRYLFRRHPRILRRVQHAHLLRVFEPERRLHDARRDRIDTDAVLRLEEVERADEAGEACFFTTRKANNQPVLYSSEIDRARWPEQKR
jgi:hypothetical protein